MSDVVRAVAAHILERLAGYGVPAGSYYNHDVVISVMVPTRRGGRKLKVTSLPYALHVNGDGTVVFYCLDCETERFEMASPVFLDDLDAALQVLCGEYRLDLQALLDG